MSDPRHWRICNDLSGRYQGCNVTKQRPVEERSSAGRFLGTILKPSQRLLPRALRLNESLAILLPVYNAQDTLARRVVAALEIAAELTPRFEVAIIDDGSDDATEEIACDLTLQYPQAILARHHRPRGIDEAIHTGVQTTHGSIIIIQPPEVPLQAAQMRRLWRIGTGVQLAEASQSAIDETRTGASTVLARLMKWGQALREEGARRQSGLRMVRREMYRRRSSSNFHPRRVDRDSATPAATAPNFISRVRDFALGE